MNSSAPLWTLLCLAGIACGEPSTPPGPPPDGPPRPQAGDRAKMDGPRGGGKRGHVDESWKKADTDGDGFISAAEFAAMDRLSKLPAEKRDEIFRRLDKNGDGRIGPGEIPRRPHGGMPPLEKVDADKDGRITFEEFKNLGFVSKLPEERQRRIFSRMDRNGDGVLTPEDRPPREGGRKRDGRHGPHEMVKRLDADGDGSLSFEEFRKAPWLKDASEDEQEDRFEEMDRNGDLKIDAADFPKPEERDRPKKERPEAPDEP